MATAADQLEPARAVHIRTMTDADVAAVIRIERDAYQFPWTEGIFHDCLRVGYLCRIAERHGQLAGYAVMSVGAGEAHILNLCIHANARRVGLGRYLLTYMLDRAHQAGTSDAYLEVRPSNTIATKLYQSLGFQHISTRRGYYQAVGGREDAAVLRLKLRDWTG